MLAQMVLVLMGITLAQSSTPSYCDGKHAKLYTAWPFNNKPITSPNYPFPYGRIRGDCLWMIQSSYFGNHNFILKVVFNDFELEEPTSSGCRNVNNLKFYDGPSSKSTLLGTYCGTAHPDVIYSTGQYLLVHLHVFRAKYRGFSFNVSVVQKEEASAICRVPSLDSNVTSLNGSSGTFFSPNFPAPYPNGAFCIWAITVSVDKIVKLTFENFTIVNQFSWECSFVEIRDSLSSNATELARSSCNGYTTYFPSVLYSTGRYMWVKFLSNVGRFHRKKEDRGFKVHFEAVNPIVDKELCLPGNPYNNFLSLTSDKGTLMTPMKYYPPNLSCNWFITVPEGNTVWITIKRFNVGRLSSCGDYIEFLDGSHNRIEKLCGYDLPPDVVRSSSRYMIVMFRSDGEYHDRLEGFEATFKAVREKPASDEHDGDSDSKWKMGVIMGVVGFAVIVFCLICIARKRRPANSANTDANIPMTASHDTQPPPSPPGYPYPPYSPPPYPDPEGGEEKTPQYPPPGESYPWLQKNDPAHPSV